jgi:GNAT superfamily N-acetyltransferase
MRTNKAAYFMAVEDTEENAIIACAHWDVYPEERTAEQVDKLCHKSAPPSDANAAAWTDFFGHFAESRRALGTRPIAILHTLVTNPRHQGRGAGKLLVQKFVEQVDEAGLEAYLEGYEMATPLYAKFGFQPSFEKVFDLAKYGGQGCEVNTVMLRPAKASD